MKKCFQAKGVCTITAHTPLSATLVWQLSHYLFRETCFMNSYPTGAAVFVAYVCDCPNQPWEMAPVGQVSAQEPQSMQVLASMTY